MERRCGSSLRNVSNAPPAEVSAADGAVAEPADASFKSANRRSNRSNAREIPKIVVRRSRETARMDDKRMTSNEESLSNTTSV